MRELNEQKFCGWCGSEVRYIAEWASECTGCGYKNYLSPKPCSNIVVVKDGKVLMVRRAIEPHMSKYDLPGGFAEFGDVSMEEASLREFEEETGLSRAHVSDLAYLGSRKSPPYNWQNTNIQNLSFFYVCTLNDDAPETQLDSSENSEVLWVGATDLPNIDFAWDIDKELLEKYFEEHA